MVQVGGGAEVTGSFFSFLFFSPFFSFEQLENAICVGSAACSLGDASYVLSGQTVHRLTGASRNGTGLIPLPFASPALLFSLSRS